MFAAGGIFYVYFVYGMHWMLNIVTSDVGYPAAVLIRGVRGIAGPGRLTKALRITGALNGKAATERSGLWIEEGGIKVATRAVRRLPRIGVAYAGAWAKKPYRFLWECDA
jgi:DNA-3-methyladenine glycosylase